MEAGAHLHDFSGMTLPAAFLGDTQVTRIDKADEFWCLLGQQRIRFLGIGRTAPRVRKAWLHMRLRLGLFVGCRTRRRTRWHEDAGGAAVAIRAASLYRRVGMHRGGLDGPMTGQTPGALAVRILGRLAEECELVLRAWRTRLGGLLRRRATWYDDAHRHKP